MFHCFCHHYIVIRPYCKLHVGEIHRGDYIFILSFSPLFVFYFVFGLCFFVFMSGRLHRVVIIIKLSFSPLWTGSCFLLDHSIITCRGDTQVGVLFYLLSFSPLWTGAFPDLYMSGRYTGESIFQLSFSSLWTDFVHFCWPISRGSFLCILSDLDFECIFAPWQMTQWWGMAGHPYTMYIYSLRPFLTTKGALIDGDWGGSKNCPKTQKSVINFIKKIKITQNRSKKVTKKWSKNHDS